MVLGGLSYRSPCVISRNPSWPIWCTVFLSDLTLFMQILAREIEAVEGLSANMGYNAI